MVVHTHNSSVQEAKAEAGEWQVGGQPGLHGEPVTKQNPKIPEVVAGVGQPGDGGTIGAQGGGDWRRVGELTQRARCYSKVWYID